MAAHFGRKRAFDGLRFAETNALPVSQFPPHQSRMADGAMARNGVIAGVAHAMLVVDRARTAGC